MTTEDLMKLADKFAFFMPGSEEGEKARQALLDALEALGREVAELKATAEADGHAITWATQQVELIIKERDQARAELAAIRATQEPVGVFVVDDQGRWVESNNGTGTPLYASPVAKDAGLVADGWQWVPVEPTEAMVQADIETSVFIGIDDARRLYAAMLAASPKIGGV